MNKTIVYILLVIFAPVGLYFLWKSELFAKQQKIVISCIVGVLLYAISLFAPKNPNESTKNISQDMPVVKDSAQLAQDSIEREQRYIAEQKEKRKELIENQFSKLNGAHRLLEERLIESLNDPDSYEHVETRYSDKGDYLIVVMKYRAKNGFGAKMLATITAKISIEGVILEAK